VGLKGGLKFYGANNELGESLSQYSRSRGGGPLGEFADGASRVDYDGMSMQDGSIDNDPRLKPNPYDYDKHSMHSIPQKQEFNGGFPITGEEGVSQKNKSGRKKKKKKKDDRPNTV
jgi:hypothetical protein